MNRNIVILALAVLFLGGCATLEGPNLKKISELETELKGARDENTLLKDKVKVLEEALVAASKKEKVVFKMPTGNEIQQALKNAGFYNGEVDGQIGLATKEPIKKFQEKNELNADGVMGSRTWEKLAPYLEKDKK